MGCRRGPGSRTNPATSPAGLSMDSHPGEAAQTSDRRRRNRARTWVTPLNRLGSGADDVSGWTTVLAFPTPVSAGSGSSVYLSPVLSRRDTASEHGECKPLATEVASPRKVASGGD